MKILAAAGLLIFTLIPGILMNHADARNAGPDWLPGAVTRLSAELATRYGEAERHRIEQGLRQAASLWRQDDGDENVFAEFVRTNFTPQGPALDTMFTRFENLLEQLSGHMHEINREFRTQSDLDSGPIMPYEDLFAGYDPSAHIADDFFQNKIAFVVLLNFPLTTLDQRLTDGAKWSRREWAEARLAEGFSKRVPADVNLTIARISSEADKYISEYNVWMHHVLDVNGKRLFPAGLRLLSHWNLRDQIKADYSDPDGPPKQRLIQKVMERIVTQTIPDVVVNNPNVDWNPYTNDVTPAAVKDADVPPPAGKSVSSAPEPDTRYAVLLSTFKAARMTDPYSPSAPTLIARRFEEDREIPEARVRAMFERILSSPLVPRVARLIGKRLGRPVEPFDLWYNGFSARGTLTEAQLDSVTSKRYPTAAAYKTDIPNLLKGLGFSPERAAFLASRITVDPARGSGHAMGAQMRSENAHLRTRVEKNGMNYKGFNIAVHEMGHNIEQIFSLTLNDHTLLQGVPNTAFTEALAFVFQGHDLELLGLSAPDPSGEAMKTLNDFWAVYEIAGVSLVDMAVWHWMYDHPDATPADLKNATVGIARDVWNKYYAPVFGTKDVVLLGIYSHMIDSFMYLPDYPLGHMIAFQVEQQMKKAGAIGPEFERMAKMGRVAPDLWMTNATGAPVGPDAILTAASHALEKVDGGR
jgi:hypothetical protein